MEPLFRTRAYLCSESLLLPETILHPGQVIKAPHVRIDRYRQEMDWERLRKREFPAKPSRLHSNFVWRTADDAAWFIQQRRPNARLYEARYDSETYQAHTASFLCLPPVPTLNDEEAIRHYWAADLGVSCDQNPGFTPLEIVTASPVKIIREVPAPLDWSWPPRL